MTYGPFVSSYDQMFLDAFGRGMDQLPEDLAGLIKEIVDKIHTEVVDRIEYYVREDMVSAAFDHIRDMAAKVCSSMLANALAGDDKEIRNLFGFSDWYMKYSYLGGKPTQWALIDAIVARRPDIFLEERLAQRDREIADLTHQKKQLNARLHKLLHPEPSDE